MHERCSFLTLKVVPRANTHARPFGTHGLHDGIDDLEREAQTILDRPSVLVRAVVGHGLQELVQKVPIGRMHLDAVETGFDRASAISTVEKQGGLIAFGRDFIANVSGCYYCHSPVGDGSDD